MPQIFRKRANTLFRWFFVLVPASVIAVLALVGAVNQSDFTTRADFYLDQPVPFSHRHHVGEIGIDCRYCHTTVETQRSAMIPGSETCMNCHSYLWNSAALLKPVRDNFEKGTPLKWTRVNSLPDFVYFNHGIHIKRGVSCTECHGHMENEALTAKAQEFNMQFCLNCHKNPAPHLRPAKDVFNFGWQPPITEAEKTELERKLMLENHVQRGTDCWRCHR